MEIGPEMDKVAAALTVIALRETGNPTLRQTLIKAEKELAKCWGMKFDDDSEPMPSM